MLRSCRDPIAIDQLASLQGAPPLHAGAGCAYSDWQEWCIVRIARPGQRDFRQPEHLRVLQGPRKRQVPRLAAPLVEGSSRAGHWRLREWRDPANVAEEESSHWNSAFHPLLPSIAVEQGNTATSSEGSSET